MKCLVDADVLLYEIGACGQYIDEDSGELVVLGFDYVADLLDQRIKEIKGECWADEVTLYLTNNPTLHKVYLRQCKTDGVECPEYKPNFREAVAVSKPYKGTRKSEKPFHYRNLMVYMLANYDTKVANGYEADDLMAIDQTDKTIICTRDKDLRMVEGLHFGWPCGNQPQFGVMEVKGVGEISLSTDRKTVKGWGSKFFYSQLITGDTVDNIGGLPRGGAVLAYETLKDLETDVEMYEHVSDLYKSKCGDDWFTMLTEQANLLWMVRALDEKGEPVLWKPPIMNS
jgi:hypothetical protein